MTAHFCAFWSGWKDRFVCEGEKEMCHRSDIGEYPCMRDPNWSIFCGSYDIPSSWRECTEARTDAECLRHHRNSRFYGDYFKKLLDPIYSLKRAVSTMPGGEKV